jgi:MATE family multidrug resistance protein
MPPDQSEVQGLNRRIWRLAGPMILSNLTVPLLGMVDTAVLGHLPEPHHLGAAALGALIFSFLYWGFGFLRMGTTGLVAQAYGRDDGDELRALLGRGLLIGGSVALMLLALQGPIERFAFHWVDASVQVVDEARHYYAVRIWSAPAALANYVLLGWFIGMHNARAPLAMLLLTNGINVALDLWFVVGLGWGVTGVAGASVIADYAGVIFGFLLVARQLRLHPGHWRRSALFDTGQLRRLVSVNGDIFIRTISLMFAFAFFTLQGARQGEVILAVNAVLMNLQTFMAYALDGFAHAAEALVGGTVGRREPAQLRQVLKGTARWSLAAALIFGGVYAFGGKSIVELLTDIPDIRAAAGEYLPWLIASPIISVWSFWLDGVFIGAVRTREMRDTMLIALIGVYLPVWWLAQNLGNHGLWLALMAFLAARGVGLGIVLLRRRSEGMVGRPAVCGAAGTEDIGV